MSIYGSQGPSFLSPLRGNTRKLVGWAKQRATTYGVAAGLLLAAVILLAVATGVATAALFYFIELRYGPWTAYGVTGGSFAALGTVAILVALRMLKRQGPPVPRPPSTAKLFRQAAPLMATRLASAQHSVATQRADGTTRLLAAGAALLLIGLVASSNRQRHLPSEES
jgi:Putative Actinobacterial Holin-X, holin superfamily III